MKIFPLIVFMILSSCQSATHMQVGDYSFVHFNDPECMGASASGALITKKQDVIRSQISQKTGYCESITGQVITSTGEAVKGYMGGRNNRPTQQNNTISGSSSPVIPDVDEIPVIDG